MAKLCKCGAIVDKRCERCYPQKHDRTTKERGYGNDHRQASKRYRDEHPLCECCVMRTGVVGARSSKQMHHIHKVASSAELRMRRENWLAVCKECHAELEENVPEALKVKRWSEASYEAAMHTAQPGVGSGGGADG